MGGWNESNHDPTPIRDQFTMAATCETYRARLMELFNNNEAEIKAGDEFCRKHMPKVHHLKTWCAIARIDALVDYLPSERGLISFLHDYEVK
jgi:hypothetical protein